MNRMSNYTTRRTDKDVLSAIQAFAERGDGVAVREIAAHIECSERTVQYSIRRLEQSGRLKVLDEKGHPSRYEVI